MNDTIIFKLNNLHHRILSHFAERDNNKYPDFRTEVMKRFGFEKIFGWNIMLNAIYLIEDTELAKISFLKFGLQGPSRYDDVGEKYLRLYGILNSIYQQYLAVSNLLELYKIPNKSKIIAEYKNTRIIELRNKIGAHSANFIEDKNSNKKFDVFEVSRDQMNYENILILKNQEDFDKFDLYSDIKIFDKLFMKHLSGIIAKVIKKVFNNHTKFKKELDLINEEIKGNTVIKIKDEVIIFKNNIS
ncbi:MAG: hypothetical protein GY932_01540 [Arcobacter sp.]|nr:hypothetical protein [Arcobacter sp.]